MMNEAHEMPRCKNTDCDHANNSFFVKTYDGYCLACADLCALDLKDEIETLAIEIEELKTKLAECYDVLQVIVESQSPPTF
jgi:hypothetical protein